MISVSVAVKELEARGDVLWTTDRVVAVVLGGTGEDVRVGAVDEGWWRMLWKDSSSTTTISEWCETMSEWSSEGAGVVPTELKAGGRSSEWISVASSTAEVETEE